jgi:hypothetical protein
VHRATAETLAFVMPGLLHQLGNLMLTIHGQALILAPEQLETARRAILGATVRGSGSVHLLRYLLGDPAAPAADPTELLAQIAELVRVPLREADLALELRLPEAAPGPVQAGHFVVLVVEALRKLVAVLPRGGRGQVVLELLGGGPKAVVRLRFEPGAGDLPFPLAASEVQDALTAQARDAREQTACRALGRGVELEFRTGAASPGREP